MNRIVFLLFLASLLTGCASKQRFGYPISPAASSSTAGRAVEILPISDTRTNRLIDRHFTTNLLAEVREVVGKELESTGLFKPALTPKEMEKHAVAELRLKTELLQLEWEVPHYNRIVGITFAVSLFTGGIGGLIYAATETDVNGHVLVHFALSETGQPRVLLDNVYLGTYTERRPKLSCDTSETQARVTTEAFKNAASKFKVDLHKLHPTSSP